MVSLSCTYNESCALFSIAQMPHKHRDAVPRDKCRKMPELSFVGVTDGMSGDSYVA